MPNLLIEIGTEELPASVQDVLYDQLSARVTASLDARRIGHDEVRVEVTPRRIALWIGNLAARQKDQVLEISGPSVEKAYDAAGKPTPALEGFLRSRQAKLSEVEIRELPKGRFVFLKRTEKGKAVKTLIPEWLEELIRTFPFAKTMRWEPSGFRFPRPIRWLVVLFDKTLVPCRIAGVRSGTGSRGHRFLAARPFKITSADWALYRKTLKTHHVLLTLEERIKRIEKELREKYGQSQIDEELLRISAQLVEEPFLLKGNFSKTYLELPPEVLASCMKKNQKIFACYDRRGKLTGNFIAVLNGKRTGLPKIQADYENVLESRLKDAQFFYREDVREPLEKKVPLLQQIVYLGRLGTMLDKTNRLVQLADSLAGMMGRDDLREPLKRAAYLSKADLITHLVYEFPDLQGIAGREYAAESGEPAEVAEAVGGQYLPKNLAEDYQDLRKQVSVLGALLGIVDRLDHLAGAYADGKEPSGSQDPFALRRAGGSLVKLVRSYRFPLALGEAVQTAVRLYRDSGVRFRDAEMTEERIVEKLKEFIKDRMVFELKIKAGTRMAEIFEAVARTEFDNLADVLDRFEMLLRMQENEADKFLRAAKVVERTSNILKGAGGRVPEEIDPALLQEPLEKELYEVIQKKSNGIEDTLKQRDYARATALFGEAFYRPLDEFFSKIMVNVEDSRIRSNRQALMNRIFRLYAGRLADLSVLSRIDLE